MKQLFWAAAASAVVLTACGTDEPSTPTNNDTVPAVVETPVETPVVVPGEMPAKYNDFQVTESGLRYKIHKAGTGKKINLGDKVNVHYRGTFTSGEQFDASYDRGEPFGLLAGLDMVIDGWNEGIPLLTVGDSAEFYIPWNLAYGEAGSQRIPAKSDLVFVIQPTDVLFQTDFDYAAYEKVRTESGLTYFVVEEGDGVKPQDGSSVSVHYNGTFTDGNKFDASYDRGAPYSFTVGRREVIAGWDEVLMHMSVGSKIRAIIPFYLAYGQNGRGSIPPYSTLIFDMELMSID